MTDPLQTSDEEIARWTGRPENITTQQYDRVLQIRTNIALKDVAVKLAGVMETIYRTSQSFQERADQLLTRADRLISLYTQISEGQKRQQTVIIFLTIALVLCTIAYTWTTYESVQEMKQANTLQREAITEQRKVASQRPDASKKRAAPPATPIRDPGR